MAALSAASSPKIRAVRPLPGKLTLVDRLRRDPLHTAVGVAGDIVAASIAVTFSISLGGNTQSVDMAPWLPWLPWLFVPIVILVLASRGMYHRSLRRSFLDEFGPVQTSVALATLLLMAYMVITDTQGQPSHVAMRLWVSAAVLLATARMGRAQWQRIARRHYGAAAPTLIIGGGQLAHQIIARTQQMAEYGLCPVGVLDREPPDRSVKLDGLPIYDVPYLGTPAQFADAARATNAEELIIAFADVPHEDLVAAIRGAHQLGIRVWLVPRLFDTVGESARVEHLGGMPLLVLKHVNPHGWQFLLKGVIDRTLSSVGLLLISPIFLTLALLVRLSSPGPIFFKQKRVGRDGKPFDCYKFRSMRPPTAAEATFELKTGSAPGGVEGVDRRTPIGKFMRKTSLDELPQLLNVINGDMSLVGPRPERPEFVELFDAQIRRYGERHRVKAGVTGWAQVNGLRGQTSIADRAEWDNYYIENWSVWLDIKILLLTVPAMLRSVEE
ncbi:undecaprenyl-phosphate glucose phosphotransferase [soil metagenome]